MSKYTGRQTGYDKSLYKCPPFTRPPCTAGSNQYFTMLYHLLYFSVISAKPSPAPGHSDLALIIDKTKAPFTADLKTSHVEAIHHEETMPSIARSPPGLTAPGVQHVDRQVRIMIIGRMMAFRTPSTRAAPKPPSTPSIQLPLISWAVFSSAPRLGPT
jgi:hypothetical protein